MNRISKHNKEEVLQKAEKDLATVTDQYISRLVRELQGTDFWKLRRAYSPGVGWILLLRLLLLDSYVMSTKWYASLILQVQEYVEAATFCKFCRTGTLLNLDEMNATLLPLSDPSLEPLQINVLDYLLGVIFPILLLHSLCEEQTIGQLINRIWFLD